MQYGTYAHGGGGDSVLHDFLDGTLMEKMYCKVWTNTWPPNLLDIEPVNYFFMGCIQDRVFATSVSHFEVLKAKIQTVVCTVTQDHSTRTLILFCHCQRYQGDMR